MATSIFGSIFNFIISAIHFMVTAAIIIFDVLLVAAIVIIVALIVERLYKLIVSPVAEKATDIINVSGNWIMEVLFALCVLLCTFLFVLFAFYSAFSKFFMSRLKFQ